MEQKQLTYDKSQLVEVINSNYIEVPVLATSLKHKVILAETFLLKAQEACGLSKKEFQKYINGTARDLSKRDNTYRRDEFIDKCIEQIRFPGAFKTFGYEKVEPNPYIYLHLILDK